MCYDRQLCLGVEGEFDAYLWSNESEESSIFVSEEGMYVLRVVDSFGCVGMDTVMVTVDEDALPNELYVPNAFTPNGDNLNDVFPYSEEVLQPEFYIVIYTRWGEKVFDSRTSDVQYWDGTYQGEIVWNQTFIYYMQYRGCDGVTRVRKGTVNPLY